MRRSLRVRRGSRLAALAIFLASSGCWIVAGLEDRTLLVGDTKEGGSGDGPTTNDGPSADGAVEGGEGGVVGSCNVDDPFLDGGRRLNVINQDEGAGAATLSGDEKEILFGSKWDFTTDAGGEAGAFWRATRSSVAGDFGDVARVSGMSQGFAQGFITRGAVGGPVFYTSYPDGTFVNPGIFVSDPINATTFSAGAVVPSPVTTPNNEDYVFLSANGAELLVGRTVGAEHRLYLYTATGAGKLFDKELELASVHDAFDAGSELFNPVLSPDGQTLYFAVDDPTTTQKRVAQVKRDTTGAGFNAATIVDHKAINNAGQQYPVWASADNCRLYVAKQVRTGIFDLVVFAPTPR